MSFLSALMLVLPGIASAQTAYQRMLSSAVPLETSWLTQEGQDLWITAAYQAAVPELAVIGISSSGEPTSVRRYGHAGSPIRAGQLVVIGASKSSAFRFIAATIHPGTDSSAMLLARLDADGQILWCRRIGGGLKVEFARAAALGAASVVLAGTARTGLINEDGFACRVDTGGNVLWARSFGGIGRDILHSVSTTRDGDLLMAGVTYSYSGPGDMLLVKMSEAGDLIWTRTYDFTIVNQFSNQIAYDAIENSRGQLILCGTAKTVEFGPGSEAWAPVFIKTDTGGQVLTARFYDINSGNCDARVIRQRSDTEYVFIGRMGASYALMTKLDSSGVAAWSFYYSPDFADLSAAQGIGVLSNGYLLAGNRYSAAGDSVLLVRTDTGGNSGCGQQTVPANAFSTVFSPAAVLRTFAISPVSAQAPQPLSVSEFTMTPELVCSLATSTDPSADAQPLIYPNPHTGHAPLRLDLIEGYQAFQLYDAAGRLLLQGSGAAMPVQDLPSGVYHLRVQTRSGLKTAILQRQ